MQNPSEAQSIIGELESRNLLQTQDDEPKLSFYGGPWMSFLPFSLFVVFIIITTFVWKSSSNGALWLPPFLALVITFFFAKDKTRYTEVVIEGMASREALLPIVCWLFAGVFSELLKSSGLATALAGLAIDIGFSAVAFVVVAFLACALFATAAGTGFGTIAVGMGILYPSGIALGCDAGLLAGAIVSGAAFGDNIAPISDTTICSASTQGVDIPGVVKSRLKYAIPAGIMAIAAFIIVGIAKPGVSPVESLGCTTEYDPLALLMLISVGLTIAVAYKTGNIISATCISIVAGSFIGLATGQFNFLLIHPDDAGANALITIGVDGNEIGGILYSGLSSMIQMSIMVLLLFGTIAIMRQGGGDDLLIDRLKGLVSTPRRAEIAVSFMIISLSSLMGLNAPAILAVGPTLAKPLAKRYDISPYRMANLLDAQSNTLAYALPWTPTILLTTGLASGTAVPLMPIDVTPYVFYGYALLVVMMASIAIRKT